MYWMTLPLRRYADFSGRSRRLEYWMFNLFLVLAFVALLIVMVTVGGSDDGSIASGVVGILMVLFFLLMIVPAIAVQVRRFHDQNLTGWLVLLGLIPYIGGFIALVFMCIPGTAGDNDYGPDPKGDGSAVANVFA